MCRRPSLMSVTLTGAVLGVTRTSLQQLLGAWNFALSFRREALCCLDVAFLAARTTVAWSSEQSQKSAPPRLNFGLPRLAFESLSASLSIDLFWCHLPKRGNPADAPSRGTSLASWRRSLSAWPPQVPSVQFGSAAVARKLKLLREPLSEAALGNCYQPED